MKKLLLLIAASWLTGWIVLTGSPSSAADLNDHELYKIVTYTFNSHGQSTGVAKASHFEPLLITSTKADIFSGLPNQGDQLPYTTGKQLVQSFGLAADYQATPRLTFHGVIGVTKNAMDTTVKMNFDSSWEANIGVMYKLFNNFSYEMHFGFMDGGDLFKNSAAYNNVESVVMVSNQISMSF